MTQLIRVLAIILGAMWALFGFGIVDWTVMVTWNAWFIPVLPLEASWGSVVTSFVAMPFLVVAVRPPRWADLVVMAALVVLAVIIGSTLAGDPATLWLAALVAVTAGGIAIPGVVGRRAGEFGAHIPWRPGLDIPLAVLGVVAIPLWGVFVVDTASVSGERPSDITLGLDHWAMHIAAGLLVPAGAILAALVGRVRTLAATAAALTSISIGVAMAVSQSYPVATASAHWSVLAVLWGTAVLLAAMWAMARAFRRSGAAAPNDALTPNPAPDAASAADAVSADDPSI